MSPFGPSHYDYLEEVLPDFFEACGVDEIGGRGIIVAHGDKAYGYKHKWKEGGLHFFHGVAIFLLTYCRPYGLEVRATETNGWVDTSNWVLENKDRFLKHLPDADEWIRKHYCECGNIIEAADEFKYDDGDYEFTIKVCGECFDREATKVINEYHGRN